MACALSYALEIEAIEGRKYVSCAYWSLGQEVMISTTEQCCDLQLSAIPLYSERPFLASSDAGNLEFYMVV